MREEPRIPPRDGDLFGQLYAEIRELAAIQLRAERADHTLQPTALVHEAWLRMRELESLAGLSEPRFRALAAKVVRNVLIDHARGRNAVKRGGGAGAESLPSDAAATHVGSGEQQIQIDELERVLQAHARRSPRQAEVVELRFFAGLSYAEVAAQLSVSVDTVKRDWRIARAWLNRALDQGLPPEEGAE